jgi:heat-inducible transcriptional repressor
VGHFIQTGRPVGSTTLKEAGFGELSTATIRNYFAHLEQDGYLVQLHASGGRVPTNLAYRMYANAYLDQDRFTTDQDPFQSFKEFESREIALFLQESAEKLSQKTNCGVFLSAPRFDHDYVIDFKVVAIDSYRCLCVLITDFGVIQTEILHLPTKLSSFALKRIEGYFQWRLTGVHKPDNLESEEEEIGRAFYNELMVRYIVGYSNFIDEEIYRTGFSRLLAYADFQDARILASSLSLFENAHSMRLLLRECQSLNTLKYWIGEDLEAYSNLIPNCSVIAIPYTINQRPVGAVGLIGPIRMPYRDLFHMMRFFSENVSETLTRNLYKFKIHFRQPETGVVYLQKEEQLLLEQKQPMLIEDKREGA